MQRPAFFLACAVLMGAIAGRMTHLPPLFIASLGGALLALCAVLARRALQPDGAPRRLLLARLLLGCFFCLAFFQQTREVERERKAVRQVASFSDHPSVVLRGVVAEEPARRGERRDRVVMVLRDVEVRDGENAMPLECRVQVSLLGRAASEAFERLPGRGVGVEVEGRLAAPPEATHSDLFDYRAFLRMRGIEATISTWQASGARRIESLDREDEAIFFGVLAQWRRATLSRIESALPPERAGIMRAMLLGDTSGLSPDLRRSFTRIGAGHLFAVSGLHTAMVAMSVFFLCRLLMASPRVSAIIMILSLCLYATIIGFRPSVTRALIMAICLAAPFLARRAVDTLNVLSLAVFLTILVNPLALFRSDFQFSYLCAFGIITLQPTIREALEAPFFDPDSSPRGLKQFFRKWCLGGLALVISVQLATAPLLSVYYHQFSLIGLLANLVMVPYAGILLGSGWIFSLLGSLIPGADALLGPVISFLCGLFVGAAKLLAAVPGGAFALPAFPTWLSGLYYLILFAGPHMRMLRAPGATQLRRANIYLRIAGVAALLAWWPVLARSPILDGGPAGKFQLTMLDVGQGDSVFIRLPNGRAMLIDTGRKGRGKAILEYLRSQGIDELDALILTHGDADHIGSAPTLLKGVHIDRVIVGSGRADTETQERLDQAAKAAGTRVTQVAQGDRLHVGPDTRLDILWPPRGSGGSDLNERSLVLLAEFGEMTFLLTGDAGVETEEDLIEFYGPDALDAEVLKAGHHGSRSSSSAAFIEAVDPEFALISAGDSNRYGHPHGEVVERLRRSGARLYNTARRGSIDLRTDGQRLWIRATRRGDESAKTKQ